VGSGTGALHLAYILAGLQPGDEVIAPVFTCTATNIPFLYMGVKIRFADVQQDTLNMDPEHIKQLISNKTKAIVVVHYGGLPCDMTEINTIAGHHGIPVIQDAAHALGATYGGRPISEITDYTMYSFQAIKHLTTGDGGMLTVPHKQSDEAERVRWFGIDRKAKQAGIWENDIKEIGYKYQMTDVSAAIGLAGLEDLYPVLKKRRQLFNLYARELSHDKSSIKIIGLNKSNRTHAAWLFTILVDRRYDLQRKLAEKGIESNQMHFRNDRYSIFKDHCKYDKFPNMDAVEDNYLVIPLHHKLTETDVLRVCMEIKKGW
jgi:perosamine synthetase